MVYISEVEHLFPFVESTHQIYDRMFKIQDCIPTVARQLAEATTVMSVHAALTDAVYNLRDCATAVAHTMDALSDFTRAIATCFVNVESKLDPQIVEIAEHYEAFMDCLENVLNLTSRCDDALVKAEDVMVHAISYHPSIIDYVLVEYLGTG